MSRWTHIVAVIDYDTCMKSKTLVSDITNKLKDAPKITGSEEDAEIFVNQLSGCNVSWMVNGEWEEYQTRVVITILGDLRDKSGWKTKKEWKEFVSYIENNIEGYIRNITCNIDDEWKRKH